MELRTTFSIEPSSKKVDFFTPVMFVGSCFASEIGNMMAQGKMDVAINPSGTVFNPVSVMNTVDMIINKKTFKKHDLYNHEGTYLSFLHYTNFDSDKPDMVLERINLSLRHSHAFLKRADFLFITFGTARVFRFKETGTVVSNCHKLPASYFTREILDAGQVADDWFVLLDRLRSFNKKIRVIFTISPVRHWKDGAHGNQVSKAVLFLAVEKILAHPSSGGYFPAYEIMMDDLRDYRFYDTDMIHPSETAIEYIWNAFTDCYFTGETLEIWKKACRITQAMNHRIMSGSEQARTRFAKTMLRQIEDFPARKYRIDLSRESSYFRKMMDNS